jgi:hypothetical protein
MKNRLHIIGISYLFVFLVNSVFTYFYIPKYFGDISVYPFVIDVIVQFIIVQFILTFIYCTLFYLFRFSLNFKSCLYYLFSFFLSGYTIYCLNRICIETQLDFLDWFLSYILYIYIFKGIISLSLFNIFLISNLVIRKLRDRME